MIFTNDSWNKELGNWTALQCHPQRTPFHFQSDQCLRLRYLLYTNEIAWLAVIRELARLLFFRQPYPLLLNNYHNIDKRQSLNSRQLRLLPDHSLRFNNFWGTAESPKRENQSISDHSQMIPIRNRFYVLSLARAINSDKQQFVVAQHKSILSFFRNSLSTFLLLIVQYA